MDNEKNALDYAKMGADTLIRRFTVEKLPPENRFHYHQGVFLAGMERVYLLSGEDQYGDYIKAWLDYYIDAAGTIRHNDSDVPQFDDMQPAVLLFNLYKKTQDERYKKALEQFVPAVEQWPTNAEGGFWHKYDCPNQMWLDTLYMIGPYSVMYARSFDKPYLYEKIYRQMEMMRRNMTDPATGLLYHAWDDSKTAAWADKTSGCSPVFWGRAIGWYAVAIQEILDFLPENHRRRQAFINAGLDLINALIRFQDEESGLWYQVVNRGDDPQNWHEVSCSCLYTYAIAQAVRKGFLHKSYARYIHKAYQGIIKTLAFKGDDLIVPKICVGTGVGDYEFYLKRPTVQNDLHGMGAFLLMCTEYYHTCKQAGL
ncbi:MAG: glycoside hydrolase family 88 protein [Treponema sp.]|jgi:unsaturated rhamnogalacturonyl hydrolase|nr:glycoside hydrolase family 88 protein [Treponema sp.]